MSLARRLLAVGLLLCLASACTPPDEQRDEHVRNADELLGAGKTREALLELRSALQIDPHNADLNFRIAQVAESSGRLADAQFFYGETLRLDPTRSDAALARAGLLLFEDRDEARALVDAVLGREPENVSAFVVRSRIELVDEHFDEALDAARKATELDPRSSEAAAQLGKVHHATARAALRDQGKGDEAHYAAAAEAFRRAIELSDDENRWVNQRDLAKLLAEWPDHLDEAEQAFQDALDSAAKRETPGAVGSVAQQCILFAQQSGRTELAHVALDSLLEVNPADYLSWRSLVALTRREGKEPDEVLARMLAARPDDPEAHRLYAVVLASNGRLPEARSHLEAQIERGIDPPALLGQLVNLTYAYGKPADAEELVARMERDYPDDPNTVLSQGYRALRNGKYQEAIELLKGLTDLHPSVVGYQMLSNAQRRRGDLPGAAASLDRAFELAQGMGFPEQLVRSQIELRGLMRDWPAVLKGLSALSRRGVELDTAYRTMQARALYETGRPRLGRQILEQQLKEKPYPVLAVLEYVEREEAEHPEQARAHLDRALATRPTDAQLVAARAKLDLKDGDPEKALARINAVVEKGPVTPQLLLQRARVLETLGQTELAQQQALQAFDADPSLLGAANLVVSLYVGQGRVDEAIASFEEALKAGGLRPPARYLLAQLHLSAGNTARARELLEGLADSGVPAAENDLAYLLARDGVDLERATALAQEALRRLPDTYGVAHTLGYVYLRKGLYEPAVDQLRSALAMAGEDAPERPLFLFHLGQALEGLGRPDDATNAYQEALALDTNYDDARRAVEALQGRRAADSS